jgi:hypothetical protein
MKLFGSIEDKHGVNEPGYRPRLPPAPQLEEDASSPRRRGWRAMTWVILVWCTGIIAWAVSAIVIAARQASQCATESSLATKLCEDANGAGAGLGLAIILLIGFFGFVFLALIWMMTKPERRLCPACGESVPRGLTACARCGHDFALAP